MLCQLLIKMCSGYLGNLCKKAKYTLRLVTPYQIFSDTVNEKKQVSMWRKCVKSLVEQAIAAIILFIFCLPFISLSGLGE